MVKAAVFELQGAWLGLMVCAALVHLRRIPGRRIREGIVVHVYSGLVIGASLLPLAASS